MASKESLSRVVSPNAAETSFNFFEKDQYLEEDQEGFC
jgi:hypothetical protein